MSRLSQPGPFWRTALFLCVALFGLVLSPAMATSSDVAAAQGLYFLQWGTPAAIPNFIDLEAGCDWMGIGGKVFDQHGSPVNGLVVKISGTLAGRQVLHYLSTGSSQHFGPGGFELKLADAPVSTRTLKMQLLDAAREPLSLPFYLHTYADCQQNLLVINLANITPEDTLSLPFVSR